MEWWVVGRGLLCSRTPAILQYTISQRWPITSSETLPAHRRAFSSKWQTSIKEAELRNMEEVERQYNNNAHPLTDIHIGSSVAIQILRLNFGIYMELSLKLDHIAIISSRHKVVES